MQAYKDKYNGIEIPKELNMMVNERIKNNKKKKRKNIGWLSLAASVCILVTSLNVSETFAETVTNIPVIGQIANLLIVRSYDFEKEDLSGTVNVPNVTISDETLKKFINDTINEKVDNVLKEAEERIMEYKEAFIETGGTEEQWAEKNMTVTADYEVYLENEDFLSFRVYTHESLAAVYATNLFFTLDLKNQQLLTLEDLIGPNYIEIISTKAKEMMTVDSENYFEQSEDWSIRPDMNFYLNDQGETVVVFEKYEIAPGAMGPIEMIIK
ncbi:MAG: DUF3298 domain-containing protein [Clostridia bacterium]|nr:DUF3298 domain-containing protein [Clostridia bacterium]